MSKNQENTRLKNKAKRGTRGITLIALVVTIIVLLILAGISIQMLTGDNGILTRAAEAKENTERTKIIENVKMDLLGKIAENKGNDITEDDAVTILEKYFNDVPESLDDLSQEITTKNGEYKIALSDLLEGVKILEEDENTVGTGVYAKVYEVDGQKILVLDHSSDFVYSNGTLIKDYQNENQAYMRENNKTIWYDDVETFNQVVINSKIFPDSTAGYFDGCKNIVKIENIKKLNTKNVTNMSAMFRNCGKLTEINVTTFDTSNVTSMTAMFFGCTLLQSINLDNFNVSKVTTIDVMFSGCSALKELDLSGLYDNKITSLRRFGCRI